MCMCEANHEEKEQRLLASGASSAVICELVMYDNLSFKKKKKKEKHTFVFKLDLSFYILKV